MKTVCMLTLALLLLPVVSADAASPHHRRHAAPAVHAQKVRASNPAPEPASPPVTRLPVGPDTFRA